MNIVSEGLVKLAQQIDRIVSYNRKLPNLRNQFKHLLNSGHAMQKLLDDYEFGSVLDIGCGQGQHSEMFMGAQKDVTAIDYGESVYFKKKKNSIHSIVADFNLYTFERIYDCVWCSHVLEHQLNPHQFLVKIHSILKEDGILAITVPPLKETIVGGHVTLWNTGLLLYRLILAGFDCKQAIALCYGYNISVIVRKKSISVLKDLQFDAGDIRKVKQFLPKSIKYHSNDIDDLFDGRIRELSWITCTA